MSLLIKQLPVGPMMNYAYLIADKDSGVCAVVDPGFDPDEIINSAKSLNLKIEAIILTHAHFDHTGAAKQISRSCGAKIYVHKLESSEIPEGLSKILTEDGTEISLGDIKIKCLHTPGHSLGSQCFVVEKNIFTGDTLFVGGCGRVDLPGGSPRDLLLSMKKLSALDPSMIVYPGHDYGPATQSTIGEERENNPLMRANSEAMLI